VLARYPFGLHERYGKTANPLGLKASTAENHHVKLLAILLVSSIGFLAAFLPVDNRETAVSADAFVDSVGLSCSPARQRHIPRQFCTRREFP
jgi:hypothetical protein